MHLQCVVCKVVLSESDFHSHEVGKKHVKNVELWKQQGRPIPGPKKLFSTKTPSSSKVIYAQTTPVAAQTKPAAAQTKPAAAQTTPAAAQTTTAATLPLHKAKQQKVKRKRLKDEQGELKSLVPPAAVDSRKPFEQQVDDFIAQVCQTQNEHINILKVLQDVAFTFSKVMPGVMPVPYGSQATGLAFRTSDIDVYLCNPYGEDEDPNFIKKHGRIIFRSQLFNSIRLVTNARVPIIKANHITTGIELDISATSGQAVANSKLISFVMSHDPRIKRLMMLIGYIVKKCDIISPTEFKRYSINLLIIFYLQNLKVPILPPIRKLVFGIPGKTWPFVVCQDKALLKNDNQMALHELFIGFFEFYEDFPFDKEIVSPYFGSTLNKDSLKSPDVLSILFYYKIYMLYTSMSIIHKNICIQDPLLLDNNTTSGVTKPTLERFLEICTRMLQMKEKFKVSEWITEIVQGEVAKPIERKSLKQLCFQDSPFSFPTSENWSEGFKLAMIKTLGYLGIKNGLILTTYVPTQKRLKGSLETSIYPFSREFTSVIKKLKDNIIKLDEFSKLNKPCSDIENFKFVANIVIRRRDNNVVTLLFKNKGSEECFNMFCFKFNQLLRIVLQSTCELPADDKPALEQKAKDKKQEIKEL